MLCQSRWPGGLAAESCLLRPRISPKVFGLLPWRTLRLNHARNHLSSHRLNPPQVWEPPYLNDLMSRLVLNQGICRMSTSMALNLLVAPNWSGLPRPSRMPLLPPSRRANGGSESGVFSGAGKKTSASLLAFSVLVEVLVPSGLLRCGIRWQL